MAIKFYTHRSAADMGSLAQEVEKLVVLSADRYVVQLLDVGWDATPPYYVMDFVEYGSLEDQLRQPFGFSTSDTIEVFSELCRAMMHLHGKGILHCDLKPANVLLDQDGKPRIADFGQARLSHDRTAALGTLYYMAPEQASLDAVPDARWDVYALGAILYRMLTGTAPYRDAQLTEKIESSRQIDQRLELYRKTLAAADPPSAHRSLPGVDRYLADIVSRCIAVDRNKRYQSVQSILMDLQRRSRRLARRPMMVLGIFGPLLLTCVGIVFGSWAFNQALYDTTHAVSEKANESNLFKARLAARSAAEQIEEYFRVTDQLERDKAFQEAWDAFRRDPELLAARKAIASPLTNFNPTRDDATELPTEISLARKTIAEHPLHATLEKFLLKRIENRDLDFPPANSWFINDRFGNQVCSVFSDRESNTSQYNNYAYRTYFTGEDEDLNFEGDHAVATDLADRAMIDRPHISAIFLSMATNTWKVAFSRPIVINGEACGVLAVTVELGHFVEFSNGPHQYVMMIDNRDGPNAGTILEHPLIDALLDENRVAPQSLAQRKVVLEQWSDANPFRDPMGDEPSGKEYRRAAIAESAPVSIERKPYGAEMTSQKQSSPSVGSRSKAGTLVREDTGFFVLAVEDYRSVIEPVYSLRNRLLTLLLLAVVLLAAIAVLLWWIVNRMQRRTTSTRDPAIGYAMNASEIANKETVAK